MEYKPLWGTRNVSIDYCRYARGIGVSLAADAILKNGDLNKTMSICPYTVTILIDQYYYYAWHD